MASGIVLYSFAHSEHGRFSSFHQLRKHIRAARCIDISFPLLARLKPRRRFKWEMRWRRYNEYRLRPVFWRAERQCVHYLYPENTLFSGAGWMRHHSLILSCHQPGSVLNQIWLDPAFKGFFEGLRCAQAVVLLASSMLPDYERFCSPEVLRVIPHGVDSHFFCPPQRTRDRIVLTVGSWLRDYDCWAETVMRLSSVEPDVCFEVIAKPEVVKNAKEILKDFPPHKIRFLHGISDEELRHAYQRAAVLLLPLQDAGANNAMLEAMACELPVLATDLPATREYGAECAWYYTKGDTADACRKLRVLLGNPERHQLGAAARKRVLENYSWPLIGRSYDDLYRELLHRRERRNRETRSFHRAPLNIAE